MGILKIVKKVNIINIYKLAITKSFKNIYYYYYTNANKIPYAIIVSYILLKWYYILIKLLSIYKSYRLYNIKILKSYY